jgi:hypothetical protein
MSHTELVIIEAPNFMPSRILQGLLAFNANIIFSEEFVIQLPENEISITTDILKRKILIFKPTQATPPKDIEDRQLIRVANYYALDGSPPVKGVIDLKNTEIMIDEIAQCLCLTIECFEGQHFTWLSNQLRIRLSSHNIKSIVFKLLPGSFKPNYVNKKISLSHIFYKINVSDNELVITFSNLSMFLSKIIKNIKLKINLPHFNPNKLTPPSKDSRNALSYAITSARVKKISNE